MNRLFFLNYDSNKFMMLCNFLFDADDFDMSRYDQEAKATDFGGINLGVLKTELGVENLHSFTINLKLSKNHEETSFLVPELNSALGNLKKCATYVNQIEHKTKTENRLDIELYFWVNEATKESFRHYFKTAYALFQSFYFFQLLNTELTSFATRSSVASAKSGTFENLSDELPKHEAEKLLFRIHGITLKKPNGVQINYRKLSDGEHQLFQILGSILLMDRDGALFLFDEPETHFNPDWRAKLVNIINDSIENERQQDLLLTTHSPYIVSDCKKKNVFVFNRNNDGTVRLPEQPKINTFGTSISIITDVVFGKEDTISELSKKKISEIERMPLTSIEEIRLAKEASRQLGESVEKVLLFKKFIMKEKELDS